MRFGSDITVIYYSYNSRVVNLWQFTTTVDDMTLMSFTTMTDNK